MPAGISTVCNRYSVDASVTLLKKMLCDKGISIFCVMDHSGRAEAVGLDMRPTKLLTSASAMAGTPLMIAAPSTALDLPLRILVAEGRTAEFHFPGMSRCGFSRGTNSRSTWFSTLRWLRPSPAR